MSKRIYEVEVTRKLYVLAESATGAERVAERHVEDEVARWESIATPVDSLDQIDPADRETIPWSMPAAEERTIAEWFASGEVSPCP